MSVEAPRQGGGRLVGLGAPGARKANAVRRTLEMSFMEELFRTDLWDDENGLSGVGGREGNGRPPIPGTSKRQSTAAFGVQSCRLLTGAQVNCAAGPERRGWPGECFAGPVRLGSGRLPVNVNRGIAASRAAARAPAPPRPHAFLSGRADGHRDRKMQPAVPRRRASVLRTGHAGAGGENPAVSTETQISPAWPSAGSAPKVMTSVGEGSSRNVACRRASAES